MEEKDERKLKRVLGYDKDSLRRELERNEENIKLFGMEIEKAKIYAVFLRRCIDYSEGRISKVEMLEELEKWEEVKGSDNI